MVLSSDTFLRFREGKEAAFRQIFDAYYARMIYYAGNILKEDLYVEDIVSETFRKAWENREKFTSQQYLVRFLYMVTRNDCINYLNAKKVKKIHHQEWVRLLTDVREDDLPLDLERVQTELIEMIHGHLANLPSPSREVMRMSYFEHKKAREIAEELKITEENVNTIKSRVRADLKTKIPKRLLAFFLLLFSGL